MKASRRWLLTSLSAASALCGVLWMTGFAPQNAVTLQPARADALYSIPPNKPTTLVFRANGALHDGADVQYKISNYAGAPTKQGKVRAAQGKLELEVKLPEGYYELAFTGVDNVLGFTVAPTFAGVPDPFFGLDAGLSWLVAAQAQRDALICALKKTGIGVVRERLGWMQIQPTISRWDWESEHNYDSVRRLYRKHGIKLLENVTGGPANWSFTQVVSDAEVARHDASMTQLAERWGDLWAGVEVWNEIDLKKVRPATYARALRTFRAGVMRMKTPVPVVAGAFAKFDEAYLDQLADAGMLQFADALSIHPYGSGAETRKMMSDFRGWLAKRGRPELPIWISESGRAWPRGPSRPALADDVISAKADTLRGAVARSEHAVAYFPFVFTFYEENKLNYSLTDRSFTPLRSFAAYATLVRMLSHTTVAAAPDVAGAQDTLAFDRSDARITVVYANQSTELAAPSGMRGGRVFGMDGRDLGVVQAKIPVPDGLSYVVSPH
jgi:hypothetical protein